MVKHKHKFQFVGKETEYNLRTKKKTGKVFAEFICLCGEQRMVEIKKRGENGRGTKNNK